MLTGFIKESDAKERRLPTNPITLKKFAELGCETAIATGFGKALNFADDEFKKAGAQVLPDQNKLYSEADLILRVKSPSVQDVLLMKSGATHISFLDPFQTPDILQAACKANINLISLDMLPRITKAQKMDALSSQTNLAGYAAVLVAANELPKVFPMMMTAAGTIEPVRVLVVGAGVAGLQAIATAKRLGARVTAYDTRPAVKEQVESLGARFLEMNLGPLEQTAQGYAKALTEEQLAKQREMLAKACMNNDVIITTAQVFGQKAPHLISTELLEKIPNYCVVIDMAVESGGNVEGSSADKIVTVNNVKLMGMNSLASHVALSATQMYANNLYFFVEDFFNKETKTLTLNHDDAIIKGCLITQQGKIINPRVLQIMEKKS